MHALPAFDWPADRVGKTWYELAHRRHYICRRESAGTRACALSPHRLHRRAPRARPASDWLQRHPGPFWAWTHAPAAPAAHWCRAAGYEEVWF